MAESLGDILKAAREASNQSTSEVGAATNIKIQFIEDLECGEYKRISAPIYAKGFIKLYAEHLGLDPQPLVAMYVAQHEAPAPAPTLMPEKKKKRRAKVPKVSKKAPATAPADTAAGDGGSARREHANILVEPGDDPDTLRSSTSQPNEKWRKSAFSGVAEKMSAVAQALPVDDWKERFSREGEDRPKAEPGLRQGNGQKVLPATVGLILLIVVIVSMLSRCVNRNGEGRDDDSRLDAGAVNFEMTHDLPEPYAE